ncbi:hypothetical protein PanWU01x14_059980 [Parasponia andersonii]|uniref:Uncharacterized protein n=1 Tax=Parasponia andersonii TaxID=3476 RepID=A0A2P5DIN0_PARAD|nr:hypothetical protein PanWU01x14_059980 [Parasponia andersonii]
MGRLNPETCFLAAAAAGFLQGLQRVLRFSAPTEEELQLQSAGPILISVIPYWESLSVVVLVDHSWVRILWENMAIWGKWVCD